MTAGDGDLGCLKNTHNISDFASCARVFTFAIDVLKLRPYFQLTFSEDAPQPIFEQCDLRSADAVDGVFKKYASSSEEGIWAVVHLAALKAVGESGQIPLDYYKVNVGGSVTLLEVSAGVAFSLVQPQ
jgi:UDP-glucose 4-epimerase